MDARGSAEAKKQDANAYLIQKRYQADGDFGKTFKRIRGSFGDSQDGRGGHQVIAKMHWMAKAGVIW